MRLSVKIFIFVFISISITACTKIIDVKLDNTEPVLVIEGFIADDYNTCQVRLSKSIDTDQDNNFPKVSDAVITIQDDAGRQETLTEVATGIYSNNSIIGIPGRTYTLTVTVEGKTYVAKSTMPQKVSLDSVLIKEQLFFGATYKYPEIHYVDPRGTSNFYRVILYINNRRDSGINISSDEFSDGNKRSQTIFPADGDENGDFKQLMPGDVLNLEFLCIDKKVYEYLEQIGDVDGNSITASPANPITNFPNGAVGYFSAHTREEKTITVQ